MRRDVSAIASKIIPILAMVVSGCVAGPDGPSPTDPHEPTTTTVSVTVTTLTTRESLTGFRDCLRSKDVNIDRIRLDALGHPRIAEAIGRLDLSDRKVLEALEMCGHHLSAGALDLSSDPRLRDLVQDTLEELAQCLRLWGVNDFPDPVPGFDGVGSPFPNDLIPWSDPDLPAAVAACRDLPT